MSEKRMDVEPEEETRDRAEEQLPLVTVDEFYDLLMEQQEQM